MSRNNKTLTPFLKWAGGKRWLVSDYSDFFPENYNRYIEPFLGSGAVFFHLQPKKAILSDTNIELIQTYQAIKDNWKLVRRYLQDHHKLHTKKYYYNIRATKFRSPYKCAAQFIYLNRTCWNGLYRVNLKGEFNVPIGTKQNVLFSTDDFKSISYMLRNKKLLSSDFEIVIDSARDGDFVFVDPPYTVTHNYNGFIKYNEKLFSKDDQVRLRDCLVSAVNRGAKIISTNADHQYIRGLYKESFDFRSVYRKSVIASDSKKRGNFKELIISSFTH